MLKRGDSERIWINEGGAAHLEPEVFRHIVRARMRVNIDSDHLESEVWLANVRARSLSAYELHSPDSVLLHQ
jgi:hypothetical protein